MMRERTRRTPFRTWRPWLRTSARQAYESDWCFLRTPHEHPHARDRDHHRKAEIGDEDESVYSIEVRAFQVEEVPVAGGVQYTTFTMTLYKVLQGNMRMAEIHESDFEPTDTQ
jgi:hypothetical protein